MRLYALSLLTGFSVVGLMAFAVLACELLTLAYRQVRRVWRRGRVQREIALPLEWH